MTGNNTTPSATALSAFQSLMTSTAACRASGMSDGDAILPSIHEQVFGHRQDQFVVREKPLGV
jgi:hypothetical protein